MKQIADYRKHAVQWHQEPLTRLRLASFAAERYWKKAFNERTGMNILSCDSVRSVTLSDVRIDGRHYKEATIDLQPKDSTLALNIARAAVKFLESLHFRILDAILPEVGGGEHDLVGERDGLQRRSSIEVKCRQVNDPAKALEGVREDLRAKALQLWRPQKYSERVVLLFEFGKGSLDGGWSQIRCESFEGSWQILSNWKKDSVPIPPESVSTKRKRDSTPKRQPIANVTQGEQHRYVLIAGDRYTTLPCYLGRTPMKSEKKIAADSAASAQVEYRHGDWQTLTQFRGKEILDTNDFASFRQSKWITTQCPQLDSRGQRLQVRLVVTGRSTSPKFLWSYPQLEKCPWAR